VSFLNTDKYGVQDVSGQFSYNM